MNISSELIFIDAESDDSHEMVPLVRIVMGAISCMGWFQAAGITRRAGLSQLEDTGSLLLGCPYRWDPPSDTCCRIQLFLHRLVLNIE
jgi:hypothetical protein